jgi:TonB family protein
MMQAPAPRPQSATSLAPAPAQVAAVDPSTQLAAQPAELAAAPVLPRADALDGSFGRARMRKLDPRWLAAGGVAVTAVLVGVIWTSGGSEPPPAADARVETTPGAGSAVGTTTATATPPPAAAPAAPVAAAGPAPAAPAAASALTAAVATPAPAAPTPPPARSKRNLEVEIGSVRVRGGQLAAKAVTSALDENLSKLERCYADAVERKSGLEGRLTYAFNVDKTGKPAKVRKLSGTIKDAALQRCGTEAIEKTRFPKPKKRAAQITLPIEFSK